jgi:hypothetical protein
MASGSPTLPSTDPQANTPAGALYSIPLDNARQDAAPHKRHGAGVGGGSGGSGGGGSAGAGLIGSGGGSGSGGAGTSGGAGGGTSTGTAGATGSASSGSQTSAASGGNGSGSTGALLVPGGQPGSLVHSANGYGSSSAVPGVNAPASAGFRAVGDTASNAPLLAILLAALVITLGLVAGARAWQVGKARHATD